ncbi:MAG: hypothetical protein CEO21_365 [Microgenomates group bacterium Gr01-1014_80]|nr:MAG: hypothetical protein CEO21_365 [Microgenomates group bacterium Gr01-1014_80]
MNPNQPDPNNPNSTPLQPDLTSAPSSPSSPAPEPTPPTAPMQTPSAVSSFEPSANPVTEPITSSVNSSFSNPSSSPAPIEGGIDPTGAGFTWPSAINPAQAPETPGVPQPGLNDLMTTSPGSAPGENQPPLNPLTPDSQSEPAPSDLSHLVNPAEEPAPAYAPPAALQPDTLVPSTANGSAEVPNLPVEGNHSGIPKWVIGVGAALLLAVAAASAYFILGFGKGAPAPESTPATTEQPAQAPPAVQTRPIPTIATPTATGSAGFGTLPGGGGTQATSAADLLRLRQGQ